MIGINYLIMKFPTIKGVAIVKGNQIFSRRCTWTYIKGKKTLVLDWQKSSNEQIKVGAEVSKKLKEVSLGKRVRR